MMKKILTFWLVLVLAVGAAAAEGFVYSNTSVTDSVNTQNMFNNFYASGSFVLPTPGLKEGFIPQGITYLPQEDWVLVAGYRDDGGQSAIIALDNKTGEIVKEVHLNNLNGGEYNGHAGGVCATEKNIFISNSNRLYRLSLDTFRALPASSECAFEEEIAVPSRASYCAYTDGVLWVGEFQYGADYQTDRSHKVQSLDGMYRAWICGYVLTDETENEIREDAQGGKDGATPDYILATTERIQGMTIKNDQIYLSQSYGRKNPSTIFRYSNVMKGEPHKSAKLNGAEVPIWCLDSRSVNGMLDAPAMTECLCTVGDSVYVLFESGANKYMDPSNPSVNPVDEIFALTAY